MSSSATAPARTASPLLLTGLGLTGLTAAATLVDQAAIGTVHERVARVYAGVHGGLDVAGSESFVVTALLATAVLGAIGWLVVLPGARRQARWSAPAGTVLWLVGAALAFTLLTASEYGTTLVPTWLGLLGLLPPLVGAGAVVQLWRARR
ncbi:hypothetical protein [Pseudonocardia phyllosphaerae]|uniref:hypothetical protein n=1 Tax=Pseudonocardia phyllosphaerae TaxID=3390502 RepID=UPI00397B7377